MPFKWCFTGRRTVALALYADWGAILFGIKPYLPLNKKENDSYLRVGINKNKYGNLTPL